LLAVRGQGTTGTIFAPATAPPRVPERGVVPAGPLYLRNRKGTAMDFLQQTWVMVTMGLVLVGLIILFFVMRKRQQDDD